MVEAREGKDWKWSKFAWDDWLADPALSCCSAAARGVWMDLLAAAHKGIPPGHVTINGQAPSLAQLAKIARCSVRALPALLSELEQNGVFSRTSGGIIYSRRMVRDFESFQSAVKYGKRGGNPQLLHGLSHNSPVGGVNLESEEELESESESITGAPAREKAARKAAHRLPEDWQPSEADQRYATERGLPWQRTAEDFRGYWLALGGEKARKLDWSLTWQNWCRREADRRGTAPASDLPRKPPRFL